MTRFKIVLSYDGAEFVGWQRQAAGVSVQGLLEDALRVLDGRDVTVIGAGRTDAGVHALAQVAAFTLARDIDPATLVRALNANLPPAVRALDAAIVPLRSTRSSTRTRRSTAIASAMPTQSVRSSAAGCGTCRVRSMSTRCALPRGCWKAITISWPFRPPEATSRRRDVRSSHPGSWIAARAPDPHYSVMK